MWSLSSAAMCPDKEERRRVIEGPLGASALDSAQRGHATRPCIIIHSLSQSSTRLQATYKIMTATDLWKLVSP